MMIIDPPSPFDPAYEWEAHLARLEKLKADGADDPAVDEAIREARAEIERLS